MSIEHNKEWFDRVYKYLQFKNIKNVDMRHVDICNGYIDIIDNMGKFDLICIDGRRRSECIKHANTHVKIGISIIGQCRTRKISASYKRPFIKMEKIRFP